MIVFSRYRSRAKRITRNDNVPSPNQIRAMTAEIRKSWTSRERSRRGNLSRFVEVIQVPLEPRRKGF